MYLVRKTPSLSSACLREASDPIVNRARQLLADASEGLVFEPAGHTYTLGERQLRSVSEIIKEFAPFDSEKTALGCSKNPTHEHYGKSVDEILAIWEEKKNNAATAGTQVHEFGEACSLYWEGREEEIEEQYRSRICPEGFVATSPKEAAMVSWWNSLDPSRYKIVARETRIVNPVLGYAGTFDLLLYDMVDGCFVLMDYKTNENLKRWFGGFLTTPLNMIRSNDLGKYTMQQNMYGIQLDNIGIPTRQMFLIWLKEDMTFEEVELSDRYREVIQYALEERLKKS